MIGTRSTLILALALGLVAACSSGDDGGRSSSTGASGTSVSSTTRADGSPPQVVTNGGLSISVPGDWPVVHPTPEGCSDLVGPAVISGTFDTMDYCYVDVDTGVEVLFGSGGPPNSPVPIGRPEERTVNGVRAQVDVIKDSIWGVYLALLPEWDAWLQVRATPLGWATAEAAGDRLLSTLTVTPGATPPPVRPAESFVGYWFVHGSQLDITESDAVYTHAHCGTIRCIEVATASVELSADGRRLTAVVRKVELLDPDTGQPAVGRSAEDDADSRIGDTSYFEFVAPHLLKEVTLRELPSDGRFGNPYWCGEQLADVYGRHCGA